MILPWFSKYNVVVVGELRHITSGVLVSLSCGKGPCGLGQNIYKAYLILTRHAKHRPHFSAANEKAGSHATVIV